MFFDYFFQVRLYAPSDRVNQTQFALQVAVTAVDLYTRIFNVSYPLPKLGMYGNMKLSKIKIFSA